MSGDFRSLAILTFTRPFGYVLPNGWPDEFCTDHLARPFDSWVTQVVNGLEDASSPCKRNKRSCRAVGYVDDDLCIAEVDLLKVESRASLTGNSGEVGVQGLLPSHLVQIDVHSTNGVDDCN